MYSNRSLVLRRQSSINLEWLSYPYSYLNEYETIMLNILIY